MTILMDIFLFIVVGSHVLLTNNSLSREPTGYFARQLCGFSDRNHTFFYTYSFPYIPTRYVRSAYDWHHLSDGCR